jgi:hypothetical protein
MGAVGAFGRASGVPDAPIPPIISWTWTFGLGPIRVQERRVRSRTARLTLIWEIPVKIIAHIKSIGAKEATR